MKSLIDAQLPRRFCSWLVAAGHPCIYPRDCPPPMNEEYLLTGSLEPTTRPYAPAKIVGIEMCWSYNW